jgi:flagellar FliJ protein
MFRFKLEALLNHRRHQEEVCQKELARAERKLAVEQGKLRQLKNDKRTRVRDLQAKQCVRFNAADIMLSVNYIQQLSQQIDVQNLGVRDAAKQVNHRRTDLIRIVKKRKILEKLKDQQLQAYSRKMRQDERKNMDEVASLRHVRKV